jgi:hypothetical protein
MQSTQGPQIRPPGVLRVVTDDRSVIECGDLRVVFDRCGDRYGHFVQRQIGGCWTDVLASLEGDENDTWPCSPPLQTLHIEARADGLVALLVGRASSNHWSASIQPLADRSGFLFDLACRTTIVPVQLGVTYRALGQSPQILTEPGNSELVKITTGVSAGLRVGPVSWPTSFPATVRWRYRITLEQ